MRAILLAAGFMLVSSSAVLARAPSNLECVSSNRDGQRFLTRGLNQENALEESLYQCYIRSAELSARSCKVEACRVRGGAWKRIQ